MIYRLKYVWPSRLAGLAVIRAATALGWHQYAYDVADHMPNASDGFKLLHRLTAQRSAAALLRRIVDADVAMIHESEEGTHGDYQRAADHFYELLEEADDFLTKRGL